MANITRLTMIKFLELILVCVIIGLHYHANEGASTHGMLAMGTYGGYLIILVGLFAGGLMGTPVNRRIDLFFSLVGCALFIVVGALVVGNSHSDNGKYMAKGVLSIIEGVVFLIDAVLTFRGES